MLTKTELKHAFIEHAIPLLEQPITQDAVEEAWAEFVKEVQTEYPGEKMDSRWLLKGSGIDVSKLT